MSMNVLGARQIKAARALLDWSQEDLALAAQLSIATIRKLELGYISPRLSTTSVIRRAIENAGLEFIDHEGVRRRPDEIVSYEGARGREDFFDDVCLTVKKGGGDVLFVETPETGLLCGQDEPRFSCLETLLKLNGTSVVRCLLTDMVEMPLPTPRLEFRFLSRHYVDPLPFCVYGDKFAMFVSGKGSKSKMIVMRSSCAADSSRRQFYSMWEKGAGVGKMIS